MYVPAYHQTSAHREAPPAPRGTAQRASNQEAREHLAEVRRRLQTVSQDEDATGRVEGRRSKIALS